MTPRLRAPALTLTLTLAACASGPSQLYEGPARPRQEVALIAKTPVSKARIYAIDRTRTTSDSWVLPGAHVVWINFQVIRYGGDVTYTIWTYCEIPFEAAAGGTYLIESFASQEMGKGTSVKTALGARINDAEGDLVAQPRTCSGERPKFY